MSSGGVAAAASALVQRGWPFLPFLLASRDRQSAPVGRRHIPCVALPPSSRCPLPCRRAELKALVDIHKEGQEFGGQLSAGEEGGRQPARGSDVAGGLPGWLEPAALARASRAASCVQPWQGYAHVIALGNLRSFPQCQPPADEVSIIKGALDMTHKTARHAMTPIDMVGAACSGGAAAMSAGAWPGAARASGRRVLRHLLLFAR